MAKFLFLSILFTFNIFSMGGQTFYLTDNFGNNFKVKIDPTPIINKLNKLSQKNLWKLYLLPDPQDYRDIAEILLNLKFIKEIPDLQYFKDNDGYIHVVSYYYDQKNPWSFVPDDIKIIINCSLDWQVKCCCRRMIVINPLKEHSS